MLNMVVIVVVVWGMCLLVFKYGRHDPLGLVFFFLVRNIFQFVFLLSLILQFWVLDSCVFTLGACVDFIIIIVTHFSFAILWPFYNHSWVFRSFHFSVLVWKFLVPTWIFISSPSSTWLYSAVPHSHFCAHFSFFAFTTPVSKKLEHCVKCKQKYNQIISDSHKAVLFI